MSAIDALLAEIGPRWALDIRAHSQAVKDAYEPLLARAPKAGIAVERDISYGPHPRQRLDVFRPERASGAPVVAFVHGGAFVRGDKRTSDEIYDNVLYWFARQGWVGIDIEYRLAPEARHPAGAEDVRDALEWVAANVGAHGGDAKRLLLIGHSAGGTHAASYVFDPAVARGEVRASALVLVSARLRADRLVSNPNAEGVAAYYGANASLDEVQAPMHHAASSALPTFVCMAEFENPWLDAYALEFAHRLALARGRAPPLLQVPGHNHMSIIAHFNTADETLGRAILAFFDAVVAASRAESPTGRG